MQTLGCREVDVMTIADMELNLLTTSDQPGAANIISRPGVKTPDFWSPPTSDIIPMLQIRLPQVEGLLPEEYDLSLIRIKANNFVNVSVTVTNAYNVDVFSVSFFMRIHEYDAFTSVMCGNDINCLCSTHQNSFPL